MAKKKPIEDAPVNVAPPSDASIPTIPESHRDPAQRAHLWERPARTDETPKEPSSHAAYEYELPRYLHKGGESKRVDTPDECEAALSDGWEIHPSGA